MRRLVALCLLLSALGLAAAVLAQDQRSSRWAASQRSFPSSSLPLAGAPSLGSPGAPVRIVAFLNYQCPYSARLFDSLLQLRQRAGSSFNLTVLHYPLDSSCNPNESTSMHPDSCGAARAAICAEEQGQFWSMSELLFQNQRHLDQATIDGAARQVQLDLGAFAACLASPLPDQRLADDVSAAALVPVSGTPTSIINDRVISGSMTVAELDDLLKHLTLRGAM